LTLFDLTCASGIKKLGIDVSEVQKPRINV